MARIRHTGYVVRFGAVLVVMLSLALGALYWSRASAPGAEVLAPGWPAIVAVLAGDGVIGTRDGPASHARFADPFGVAVAPDGSIYVADAGNAPRIRRITSDGRVLPVAGGARGFADGPAAKARFDTPSGLAVDRTGTLYVADTGNNAIRRVAADGHVSTLAGDGTAGYRDGPGRDARFNGPIGITVDATGRVIVADTYNDRVRAIAADGVVTTLAGEFDTPSAVAADRAGNVYVADTGSGMVRAIDSQGVVSAGGWFPAGGGFRPVGIALSPERDLYVSDEQGQVIEISAAGTLRTLAGSTRGFRDGPGHAARFRGPAGIAFVRPGRLIVADSGNALVREVTAASRPEFRRPASPFISPQFDVARFSGHPLLWPVAPFEGPHEVAGTLGEARGGEGSERVHAGIDVRADQGTPVYAVRDGVVVSPIATGGFGSLAEWVRIEPVTYMHIRAGRNRGDQIVDRARFAPVYQGERLVSIRVKRGARFRTGDVVGTVNAFNHVHLNVGWPGEEHNPQNLRLLHFEDRVPPAIAANGVKLYDEHGQPLTRRVGRRLAVSRKTQIVVDAWDQADGNRPGRRLGLYQLGYQILNSDGSPAAGFEAIRQTLRFDRLALDTEAARLVYAPGSGIPFYGRRRTQFLYVVTNTLQDGVAGRGFWDPAGLPPGDYVVRVHVADVRGNVALANRDLPVTIEAPEP